MAPQGFSVIVHVFENDIDGIAHILCWPSSRTSIKKRGLQRFNGCLYVVQLLDGIFD